MDDPVVRGVAAPFAFALVFTGFGIATRSRRAAAALVVGLGGGILLGWLWLEGLASFPPPAAKSKLPYLVAAALGLALWGDALWTRAGAPALAGACAVAALVWIAWRPLQADADAVLLLTLAGLTSGALLFFEGARRLAERDGALGAVIPLVTAGAGLGGVALLGATASLALFAGSVAAAAGGTATSLYAARVIGRDDREGGGAAWLGTAALGGIAAVLALFAPEARPAALALLVLTPWTAEALRGWAGGAGAWARASRPVLLTLGAALPPLAAVGLAQLWND